MPNCECGMTSCCHCNINTVATGTVATGPGTSTGTSTETSTGTSTDRTVSFKDLEQLLIEEITRKHLQ